MNNPFEAQTRDEILALIAEFKSPNGLLVAPAFTGFDDSPEVERSEAIYTCEQALDEYDEAYYADIIAITHEYNDHWERLEHEEQQYYERLDEPVNRAADEASDDYDAYMASQAPR